MRKFKEFVHLLFLLETFPFPARAIDFCDKKRDRDPRDAFVEKTVAYPAATSGNQKYQKCYFVIKADAVEQWAVCPSAASSDLTYAIDLDLGRTICNSYEATLPIVRSAEENEAIQDLGKSVCSAGVVIPGIKEWG